MASTCFRVIGSSSVLSTSRAIHELGSPSAWSQTIGRGRNFCSEQKMWENYNRGKTTQETTHRQNRPIWVSGFGRHVSCTNYALCDICWCIFINVNKTKSKIFWIVDWFINKEHVEISSRVFPDKQLQH